MPNPDQIDIRQQRKGGVYTLEFEYNADFIAWLKQRVPFADRDYDEDTHIWTIRREKYLAPIEGVAVQKFRYAVKWYYRNGELVMKNLKTGAESVQARLF